ncbi:MAG: exopolysaccharide biosynthesis polyprenyl glycosylphosphotransferase, partial [Pseudomonadota bacterium]
MTVAFDHLPTGHRSGLSRLRLSRSGFTLVAMVFEATAIALIAIVSGAAYHWIGYGTPGNALSYAPIGLLVALVYIASFGLKGAYAIERYVIERRGLNPIISAWTFSFILLIVFLFLTKSADMVSRGWVIVFYFTGLAGALTTDWAISTILARAVRAGFVQRRRVMLIGDEAEVRRFRRHLRGRRTGVDVVSCVVLPNWGASHDQQSSGNEQSALETTTTAALLDAAVLRARKDWIDDIVIMPAKNPAAKLDEAMEKFLDLPARVHIGTPDDVQQRAHVEVSHVGAVTTLAVSQPRTAFFHRAPKRSFDIVMALLGLVLLSPLFLLIAILIKLETPGPVFFRQRRHGFNHGEFRIWKFRSMTTMDDGDTIRQAERNDARVTSIGRFLRRTNIDELPQLINVLFGQMSLVGPRPHAVAHDIEYQRRIERYARRLNVRPGITGWAQVNGCRGQTTSDQEMRARINHDL